MATIHRRVAAGASFILCLSLLRLSMSQPFVGVNYGETADNLPPPEVTAALLRGTTISRLRLYGVNKPLIRALAGTGVSIMVGTSNADIAAFAVDPAAAAAWARDNVAAFMPASTISTVSVGNEVFFSKDATLISQLAPAMRNLRLALAAQPVTASVEVSTVHAMSILAQSSPPSAGVFEPAYADPLAAVLSFLNETSSPFLVNPYPYFAYQSDPRPETLAFCLFLPNPGRLDAGSGITYTNMFDAQVDAVRSALRAAKFPEIAVAVAETGWPWRGAASELGATPENAAAYNGNLVKHLKGMAGGVPETYLFELYDENLKGGAESEKYFGLYKPDGTMNYDAGLKRTAPAPVTTTSAIPSGSPSLAVAETPGGNCITCHKVEPSSHPPVIHPDNAAKTRGLASMFHLTMTLALPMTTFAFV